MTGMSIPHPHAFRPCMSHGLGAGEEIVHSWRKRRGSVNPLVVGSNPTGPKSFRRFSRKASHLIPASARVDLSAPQGQQATGRGRESAGIQVEVLELVLEVDMEPGQCTVPTHVDKAHEFFNIVDANPSEAVRLQLRNPIVLVHITGKRFGVQRIRRGLVELSAPLEFV